MDLLIGLKLAHKVQQRQLALPAVGGLLAMEMIRLSKLKQQKEKKI